MAAQVRVVFTVVLASRVCFGKGPRSSTISYIIECETVGSEHVAISSETAWVTIVIVLIREFTAYDIIDHIISQPWTKSWTSLEQFDHVIVRFELGCPWCIIQNEFAYTLWHTHVRPSWLALINFETLFLPAGRPRNHIWKVVQAGMPKHGVWWSFRLFNEPNAVPRCSQK